MSTKQGIEDLMMDSKINNTILIQIILLNTVLPQNVYVCYLTMSIHVCVIYCIKKARMSELILNLFLDKRQVVTDWLIVRVHKSDRYNKIFSCSEEEF